MGVYLARAVAMAVLCLTSQAIQADEKLYDLVRRGYQVVYEDAYAEIEECEPDKPVIVGQYIFICNGYNYSYHNGEVMILGKQFVYEGKRIFDTFLCLDGKDECFDGQLIKK